jgi:hypothetical protein
MLAKILPARAERGKKNGRKFADPKNSIDKKEAGRIPQL